MDKHASTKRKIVSQTLGSKNLEITETFNTPFINIRTNLKLFTIQNSAVLTKYRNARLCPYSSYQELKNGNTIAALLYIQLEMCQNKYNLPKKKARHETKT